MVTEKLGPARQIQRIWEKMGRIYTIGCHLKIGLYHIPQARIPQCTVCRVRGNSASDEMASPFRLNSSTGNQPK
jgi:hypothetical protein